MNRDRWVLKALEELKKSGLKITPQRIAIIETIYEHREEHPSLNRIYSLVKEKMPTVSFSTLYTTLKKLEEIGLIRLFSYKGETRIETNTREHINIINTGSEMIRDYMDDELIREIKEKLGIKKGRALINIIIYNE